MSKIRNRPSFFGERDASRISLLVREDLFDQGECDTNPLEFLNDRSIDSSYFSAKHSIPAYGFENVRQIRDSEQPDEVDVLCVNCYECIPLSLVDIHSKFCTNPQLEEEDAETVHIDTRIKKIIVSIDIKIHQSYGDTIFTLEQLRELAYSSLDNSANPYSILSRLDRIINSILCVNQGISSIIIAKRLANLVELKSPYYDSRISNIERTLKQYDEEVEEHQKELNRWMYRSEILMKLTENNFPTRFFEISSDVGSDVEVLSISFSTGYSEFSDIDNFEEEREIRNSISNEQLKKHFYSIFLKKKQKSCKSSFVNESELYNKCRAEDVPVARWEDYIGRYFD